MDTSRFNRFWPVILEHEGGLVDDPDDLGGITKYGVSLTFLKNEHMDLNDDGVIDRKDIIGLSKENARDIFYKTFYCDPKLYYITDDTLALHICDMGINAGIKTSIRLLQHLLRVVEDGVIGNQTLTAIQLYQGDLVKAYKEARISYYKFITIKRPQNAKFLAGWINRVNSTKL